MPETEQDQPTIQQLRDRADRAAELERTTADQERKIAFLEAGINASADPRLGYFVRGYDGELTPEAIKTAATEAGFLSTGTEDETVEDPEPAAPSDEQVSQDTMATQVAAESGALTEERDVDLMDEGFSEFHKTMQSGAERRDAAAHVIGRAIAKGVGKE